MASLVTFELATKAVELSKGSNVEAARLLREAANMLDPSTEELSGKRMRENEVSDLDIFKRSN